MKTLRFEGYSDDTFGECGETKDTFCDCGSGEPIVYSVRDPKTGEGVLVTGRYGDGSGCWDIGIAPLDDGLMPKGWMISIGPGELEYSPRLTVACPDECEVTCVNKEAAQAE